MDKKLGWLIAAIMIPVVLVSTHNDSHPSQETQMGFQYTPAGISYAHDHGDQVCYVLNRAPYGNGIRGIAQEMTQDEGMSLDDATTAILKSVSDTCPGLQPVVDHYAQTGE